MVLTALILFSSRKPEFLWRWTTEGLRLNILDLPMVTAFTSFFKKQLLDFIIYLEKQAS